MTPEEMWLTPPGFVARPLTLAFQDLPGFVEAAWKSGAVLELAAQVETPFSRWSTEGDVRARVAQELLRPDALVWEVWRASPTPSPIDFSGILRLSHVVDGYDAKLDYFFFDGSLRDKTKLLEVWIDWAFEDHNDWSSLQRLTLELPVHAYAAAHHAKARLGFVEEGRQRNGVFWRGAWEDTVLLGKVRGDGRTV